MPIDVAVPMRGDHVASRSASTSSRRVGFEDVSPPADSAQPMSRNRSRLAALILAGAPALLWTQIAGVFAPADLFILPLVALGLLIGSRGDRGQALLRTRLVLPAGLITAGSLLALADVGLPSWAVVTLLQDLLVVVVFIGVIQLCRGRGPTAATFGRAAFVSGIVVSLILIAEGGYRPFGPLSQPNYAAHYIGMCIVVGAPVVRRRWLILVPVMLGGIFMTASFGALVSLPIAFGYRAYGALRARMPRANGLAVAVMWVLLLGPPVAMTAGVFGAWTAHQSNVEGLDQNRADQSRDGRSVIWKDALDAYSHDRLGLGPHGYAEYSKATTEHEIHSDYLGYLVERGPMGIIGLFVLTAVLLRSGRAAGTARSVILFNLVAGLFRETGHFRHFWIFLAVCLASELDDSGESFLGKLLARREHARSE